MTTGVRGVRGAITCAANTEPDILEAADELLRALVSANDISPEDLGSAIFSLSPDLDAAFPARAARALGWTHVPLMCTREVPVPGALARCVRVMLLWNTPKSQEQIAHVYLREAKSLRPDLAQADEAGDVPAEEKAT